MPVRVVTIERLELAALSGGIATLSATCSKGTYIRSLARDIGEALGTGAYLSNLVRQRTGPFAICDAWSVRELEEHAAADVWSLVAERSDAALGDMDALVLRDDQTDDWHSGRLVAVDAPAASTTVRVYRPSGDFVGIGRATADGRAYQPAKVLHAAA